MEITGVTYSVSDYEKYIQSGDNNYFEEVIDAMVLDGISGMNDSFRNAINGLSRDKKRMTILSLLDKDLNLFKRIKALTDKNIGKMDHIKDIILMLREYVKVGEVEKKKFGEVMTPLELVKEMLNTLPEEVWSNPNLKWLDPANGTGPYPIMVIYKLMNGLAEWEPDAEKRYKHIVENMIYVCELQPKNMFLYMCAIDPFDTYKLNIYTGSFLEEGFDFHMKNVWIVDKFDIVVGNPPYNTGTEGGNGSRDLWDKFVIKSEKIIKKNGFLLYVHPSKWRRPESELLPIYKRNNLKYLEIHSKQDGKKVFDAVTRYDWYLLQMSENEGKSIIVDEVGDRHIININDWDWIPNYNFEIIKKIISKVNNLEVIYSRSLYGNDKKWMSKYQSDVNIHPCVYGMYKDFTCSYYYSSIKKGHFGIPKVILGCGEKLYPKLDFEGNFGIMQNAFGLKIETKEEGINIKKAIESEKFKKIIESTKWLNFQTDYKMFKSFKKDFWLDFI
jgi:hypothetical protein